MEGAEAVHPDRAAAAVIGARLGRAIVSAAVAAVAAVTVALPLCAGAQVLTTQYDNARTGATLVETTLTPANVNADSFGKLFAMAVDGDVYAQPLYVPRVEIPGKGVHDVVYVATEHDSVYAFDAAGSPREPLWHVTFLNESAGVTTVPGGDTRCPFIFHEVGITPTPAIDRRSGTLYVLARTKERQGFRQSRYVQRLHALAITTGVEKFGGPVEIAAQGFDPLRELPRAGLLAAEGQVYLTWASSCDVGPYHGWVMAYDLATLKPTAVFNTSPDADQSGIWQSDNGPAADADGHVYVVTGNGAFDAASGGRDYGDSALKLLLTTGTLRVVDRFTPANQAELNAKDLDLGSGGPMLVPGTRLVLFGGKDRSVFVLDRDRMQEPVQVLKLGGGIYSAPAYWNGHVYWLAANDVLRDYAVADGRLVARGAGTRKFPNPGATPAISADGARHAIVWVIETKVWNAWATAKPAVLYGFDAADVAHELYNSEQRADRDRAGMTVRFTIPTIANGRVYVPAAREVDVYGLLGPKTTPGS